MATESACVFCRIVHGEIDADMVLETGEAVVIRDLHPQAPHHYLVIPRDHVRTLNEASPSLLGALMSAVQQLAGVKGFSERGYRTVVNAHRDGGQTVWHLHIHVLAGRPMQWPPG